MEYILDTDKWRCGRLEGKPGYSLGKGRIKLLNKEGYMSCLGQFAEQAGVPLKCLFDFFMPLHAAHSHGDLSSVMDQLNSPEHSWLFISGGGFDSVVGRCSIINDSSEIRVATKIHLLSDLLRKRDHLLKIAGMAHLDLNPG